MFKHLNSLTLFLLLTTSIRPPAVVAQEVVISKIQRINLSGNDIIKVEANSRKGVNFPFYLFIPETINKNQTNYLYVETNNTGTSSDGFEANIQTVDYEFQRGGNEMLRITGRQMESNSMHAGLI